MNVLKPHLRITVQTLLSTDTPQREIERRTGVDRKTIRRDARAMANFPGVATGFSEAGAQIPPPRPPAPEGGAAGAAPALAPPASACEPYRAWIEAQVVLGRNATRERASRVWTGFPGSQVESLPVEGRTPCPSTS